MQKMLFYLMKLALQVQENVELLIWTEISFAYLKLKNVQLILFKKEQNLQMFYIFLMGLKLKTKHYIIQMNLKLIILLKVYMLILI